MSIGMQVTFGLYLLGLIAIGLYFFFTTETKRLSDYLLAGRDVGTWPIAVSDVSSVASGWTFFAWVGTGFAFGLSGLWFSLTMLVIVLLMYRYVASPLRRESEAIDSVTVTDHVSSTFGGERFGPAIRVVATVAVVVFMVSYVGAQVIAVGEAMNAGFGIDYTWAIVIGGAAVALYTTLGGFNASVWTDFFQGILIFVGAVALPVLAIREVGGWSAFVDRASAIDPALLRMDAGLGGAELAVFVLVWVTFAMGTIGQPHSLMRFQAIRSERIVSKASVIAVAFQSLRLTVPLFIGISGRVLYGSVNDPENVAMIAITDLFPPVFAGILLAAIVSAVLSTSDSMLLVTSSDVTRFYETHVNPDADERTLIAVGRAVVVVAAGFGVLLAWVRPGTIFEIIEFAYVGLGVSLGLPLLFVLFWDHTTGAGVFAGVAVGLASSIANVYVFSDYFPILVWPVTLAAIVGASLATAGVDADRNPAPVDQ
ncbi:sodium/proline symporter [Halegenticoccus tardaugens]|uniref:sodium/proline symporter n=1 Tax=Halegenticoccus tardaugens TaxID=2071624 RepID=UPI001E655ADC|nr:sodium/proline symporter [Halegenticoccus tardaugens]